MQSILLVSDGDGSFASALQKTGRFQIFVWYYDSESELRQKYQDNCIDFLREENIEQSFGVDIFEVDLECLNTSFDIVQFNFPHTGNKVTDQDWISNNCNLLMQFFTIARHLGTDIRVVLSINRMFLYWDVDQCATSCNLTSTSKLKFDEKEWEHLGYRHQSNIGRNIRNPLLKLVHVYNSKDSKYTESESLERWSQFHAASTAIPMICPTCGCFLGSTLDILERQYLQKQHIRKCGISNSIFTLIKNARECLETLEMSMMSDFEELKIPKTGIGD